MDKYEIAQDSLVSIVDGHMFSPEMFGVHYQTPNNLEYIFFYIVSASMKISHNKRIMLCKH